MGCVHSKRDINDIHSNRFEVTNVDEMGHLVSPGQLELTETELILYQRGKSATHWPLRSLRKYGFDSEIFSFECGRRCPTGAGIYAFRCRKAEQLFNLLQQNIQLRNINDENNPQPVSMYTNSDFPTPVATTGPPVTTRRMSSSVQPQAEGYLNPTPAPVNTIRSRPTLSRPGSITSNGPVSPVSPSAISVNCDSFLEHNNNKQQQHNNTLASVRERKHSYTTQPSYINLSTATTPPPVTTENYANLCCEQPSHLYVNVTTNEGSAADSTTSNFQTKDLIPNNSYTIADSSTEISNSNSLCVQSVSELPDEPMHCYANIDASELGNLRASNVITEAIPPSSSGSAPQTPTYLIVQEMNYAELDLVPSRNDAPSPESPNDKVKKSYVTIDFKKTTALSQTVNPSIEVEEGVRKTRHNSNISDVTTRHSNSLSD